MLISTGIEMLDRMLDGGVRKGKSVLIMSSPGVQDLQFAHQLFFSYLLKKGNGVYVVNNKKPSIVKEIFKNYDWDITEFERSGHCTFLDCYSGLLSIYSQEKEQVAKPSDVDEILEAIIRLTSNNDGAIVVLDSLSSLFDMIESEDNILEFTKRLTTALHDNNTTLVSLFTHWPYGDATIKNIENMFDCIIRLKAIEQKVILRSYFSVDKAGWLDKIERREVPYKVISPGGVRVFIPKILVTGPFHAGKTSFIHSASTRAVSVQRLGTTVALDHGHVDYRGFSVDLFGTPGQERFDPILEMLGGEALGVIVIMDSTDQSGFERAKEMLAKTKTEGLPSVVVANKANMAGALLPEEIRKIAHISDDVHIVPVVAENLKEVVGDLPCKLRKEDIAKVFESLFEVII